MRHLPSHHVVGASFDPGETIFPNINAIYQWNQHPSAVWIGKACPHGVQYRYIASIAERYALPLLLETIPENYGVIYDMKEAIRIGRIRGDVLDDGLREECKRLVDRFDEYFNNRSFRERERLASRVGLYCVHVVPSIKSAIDYIAGATGEFRLYDNPLSPRFVSDLQEIVRLQFQADEQTNYHAGYPAFQVEGEVSSRLIFGTYESTLVIATSLRARMHEYIERVRTNQLSDALLQKLSMVEEVLMRLTEPAPYVNYCIQPPKTWKNDPNAAHMAAWQLILNYATSEFQWMDVVQKMKALPKFKG